MKILNLTQHTLVAAEAVEARSFPMRLVGLLGRRTLAAGQALWFSRCRAIHSWGMRFVFDAVFVDRHWRVVALRAGVRPWRLVGPVSGAWAVIELPSGAVAQARILVGDQLRLVTGENPAPALTSPEPLAILVSTTDKGKPAARQGRKTTDPQAISDIKYGFSKISCSISDIEKDGRAAERCLAFFAWKR